MRFMFSVLASSVLATAAATQARAQASVDPGMTQDQVVAALGKPLSEHAFRSFTYLFYKSGCEKTCGMNDLVVLDSGKVVDAVFRSSNRKYSGTSSSPKMIPAAAAAKHGSSGAALVKPAKTPTPSPR